MTEEERLAWIQKYTPEIDELKNKIKMARFSYVVTDPYPEHSFYSSLSYWDKKFYKKTKELSVHQAYREGMEFMWSLIEPLVK